MHLKRIANRDFLHWSFHLVDDHTYFECDTGRKVPVTSNHILAKVPVLGHFSYMSVFQYSDAVSTMTHRWFNKNAKRSPLPWLCHCHSCSANWANFSDASTPIPISKIVQMHSIPFVHYLDSPVALISLRLCAKRPSPFINQILEGVLLPSMKIGWSPLVCKSHIETLKIKKVANLSYWFNQASGCKNAYGRTETNKPIATVNSWNGPFQTSRIRLHIMISTWRAKLIFNHSMTARSEPISMLLFLMLRRVLQTSSLQMS